jgi:GH18 family chitinase
VCLCVFTDDMNHAHAYCGRANSPLDTVAANLDGWLALGVPSSKLILGLPWYGHVYHCGSSTAPPVPECETAAAICIVGTKTHPSSIGGHGSMTLWEVERLLANASSNGCVRGWSEAARSPWIDCPSAVLGRPMSSTAGFVSGGGAHTQTWYDDANSTRLKVKLAVERGLGGVGIVSAEMAGFLGTKTARDAWRSVEEFRAGA